LFSGAFYSTLGASTFYFFGFCSFGFSSFFLASFGFSYSL